MLMVFPVGTRHFIRSEHRALHKSRTRRSDVELDSIPCVINSFAGWPTVLAWSIENTVQDEVLVPHSNEGGSYGVSNQCEAAEQACTSQYAESDSAHPDLLILHAAKSVVKDIASSTICTAACSHHQNLVRRDLVPGEL